MQIIVDIADEVYNKLLEEQQVPNRSYLEYCIIHGTPLKEVNHEENKQSGRPQKNRLLYRPIQGPLPPKKIFRNKYGIEEECRSNGMEIYDHLGDCWWNEYVDTYNDFHYGR